MEIGLDVNSEDGVLLGFLVDGLDHSKGLGEAVVVRLKCVVVEAALLTFHYVHQFEERGEIFLLIFGNLSTFLEDISYSIEVFLSDTLELADGGRGLERVEAKLSELFNKSGRR